MRSAGVRRGDEVIALYERAAAALATSAELAEQETRRAEGQADLERAAAERSRAEQAHSAAAQADGNARRVRLRTRATALFGDRQPWRRIYAGDETGEQALQRLDVALIGTDMTGTIRFWNRAAEHLYGWPSTEVIGRPITDVTVGPDDGAVAERIMASIRATGAWEGEFWVTRRGGTRFLAYVSDHTVADDDGRPLGIIGLSVELAREHPDPAELSTPASRWRSPG